MITSFCRRSLPGFAALGLVLIAAAAVFPSRADAQELQGRVTHYGSGIGGLEVVLHTVTRDSAGVLATRTSAPDGSFSFALPQTDPGGFTVYFATAEHQGIRYFGRPLHPNEPAEGYVIQVYDTTPASAAAGSIRLTRRDVVLLAQPDGGWEVNEVLEIANPTDRTLVSQDGLPTWEFRLPEGAVLFEVGEGEITGDDLTRMEDRVLLLSPILPGGRELFVRYRLGPGAGRLALPVEAGSPLNLYVRQPSPEVAVRGLARGETVAAEGERFLQFSGTNLSGDNPVVVEWKAASVAPVDPTAAALVLTGLLLFGGGVVAVRRRSAPPPAPPTA